MFKKTFQRLKSAFTRTSLIDAVRDEDTEKVKVLLERGASLDPEIYRNCSDAGPLGTAINLGNKPIVTLLLEHGADMHAADALSGLRPIDQILQYRNPKEEILSVFIEKGFDVKVPIEKENGWTALHLAADRGTPVMISMLVAAGADVNATTAEGETPLHRACSMLKGKERAAALLRAGANKDATDTYGRTPEQIARKNFFHDTASLFLPAEMPTPASTTPPPAPPA